MCIVFIIIELILFVGRVTLVGRMRFKKKITTTITKSWFAIVMILIWNNTYTDI